MNEKFKIHILDIANIDFAKTYCGINSNTCSEELFEAEGNFVTLAELNRATCKKCIDVCNKIMESSEY